MISANYRILKWDDLINVKKFTGLTRNKRNSSKETFAFHDQLARPQNFINIKLKTRNNSITRILKVESTYIFSPYNAIKQILLRKS